MLVCLRIYFSFLHCFHLYKQRSYHHLAIGDGNLKTLYTGKQGGFGVVEDCNWEGWIHWQGLLLPPSLGMWTCLNFLNCAYFLRCLGPLASRKWCLCLQTTLQLYLQQMICSFLGQRWTFCSFNWAVRFLFLLQRSRLVLGYPHFQWLIYLLGPA